MKVAIQGVRASFHDQAARALFPGRDLELVECPSFPVLGRALAAGEADVAVMAIENALAGSILPNYSLLERHDFRILGETYLRIELCLMALPGQTTEDIHTVLSHPMALIQSEEFLHRELPKARLVEASDTADSARQIREERLAGHAAVAPRLAADVYGLDLLHAGIETNRLNYTRFLVVGRRDDTEVPKGANKASLRFETPHRPGSLVEVLEIFRDCELNLTKIQSIPIVGKPYQYSFHVDVEWSDEARYREAMARLVARALRITHFGEYVRAERLWD
jgi:prephenate dehydratase